jgi:hypothetical protein
MPHSARIALFALFALAGCAPLSPEAQCFADATIDYRAAWRGVRTIDANLARGHGIKEQQIGLAQAVPCRVGGRPGNCLDNRRVTLEIPVPIDREALIARRAALVARMAALRPAAMKASAHCGYGDWGMVYLVREDAR